MAQPVIPIQIRWDVSFLERFRLRSTVDTNLDVLDVAQQSFLNHVHCTQELVAITTLLRSDKEDLLVKLATSVSHQLVFFQSQRQRFLAKHVLAGLQRFDRDFYMPVIGCCDANDINVISLKNFAIVRIGIRFAFANSLVCFGAIGMFLVNVGNRNDVSKPCVTTAVTRAHSTQSDSADNGSIVLGFVRKRFF